MLTPTSPASSHWQGSPHQLSPPHQARTSDLREEQPYWRLSRAVDRPLRCHQSRQLFHCNVYKPPSGSWDTSVSLPALSHPAIHVGDFNSHHPDWGYDSEDAEGVRLMEWASHGGFALIHDPKQRGTFRSTWWQRDFSPDLCWVSTTNCSMSEWAVFYVPSNTVLDWLYGRRF